MQVDCWRFNMIKVMCQTPEVIRLGKLTPFQGDLKKRTSKDVHALAESILNEGLLMPFAVWHHDDVDHLLDGHGRLAALTELALQDNSIGEQDFPVIYIEAENEEQAKKSLLQITSAYGKITRQGAVGFCQSIPSYHAPAINKFVYRKPVSRVTSERNNETVIRIAVPNDKAQAVLELFKTVSYIKVL